MALSSTISPRKSQRWLIVILLLALALRLVYGLAQDHAAPYESHSHDSNWYLAQGYTLITDQQPPHIHVHVELEGLPTAPLYLVYIGIWEALFAPIPAMILLRVGQVLMSAATCYFAYRIGTRVGGDERVGLLTAAALAISPVFIIEAAQVTTETLFIFCVLAGLSVYLDWVAQPDAHRVRSLALAGIFLGLATLTRAVALLFPLGIALHILLIGWRAQRRVWLKRAGLLLIVYVLTAGTWTAYNLIRWNRLIIGAEGFAGFLFVGARAEGWQEGTIIDQSLEGVDLPEGGEPSEGFRIPDEAFVDNAARIIRDDPLAYIQRRVSDLLNAYLQPHGTVTFPGASLKDMTADWLNHDRSFRGLIRLTQGDYFWPKLVIYLLHYTALIGGLVGIWLCRRRWVVALVPLGYIVYTSLLHLVLDAIPRYIFPTEALWWVFASVTLVALVDTLAAFRQQHWPAKALAE